MREYYVYILSSGKNGTLYVGVTGDLIRRVREHKEAKIKGFTKKYQVDLLVHYESTDDVAAAIGREKQLKAWKREWKIKLIEESNPTWRDLFEEISQG
jgi:putative endonuclease